MIKLDNLKGGLLFSLIVNMSMLWFTILIAMGIFMGSMNTASAVALSIILVFILAGIILFLSATYFWESLFVKFQLRAREPNEREGDIILIFNEVYEKVKAIEPNCPDNITLKIRDSDEINACAVGKRTIIVNTGLIRYRRTKEEVAGVIAHEFGHLVHGDTINMWFAIQLRELTRASCFSLEIITCIGIIIVSIIIAFAYYLGSNSKNGSSIIAFIGMGVTKGFKFIFHLVTLFILRISLLFILKASRDQEFDADSFSVKLQYGLGLASALERINLEEIVQKNSDFIMQELYGTHPDTGERIKRIREAMA